MNYENMMGMHAIWWVFWVGLIVSMLIWGGGSNSERRGKPRETPHEALRRRLASGEVSIDEYEKRKTLLDRDSKRPRPQPPCFSARQFCHCE